MIGWFWLINTGFMVTSCGYLEVSIEPEWGLFRSFADKPHTAFQSYIEMMIKIGLIAGLCQMSVAPIRVGLPTITTITISRHREVESDFSETANIQLKSICPYW